MPVRWDSVLTRAVAEELSERLSGARCRAVHLHARSRTVWIFMDDAGLEIALDPAAGSIRLVGEAPPHRDATPLNGRVLDAVAPPDERRLILSFLRKRGKARRVDLVLEWAGNRRNAVMIDPDGGRVEDALPFRGPGSESVRPGGLYRPPAPPDRDGVDGEVSFDRFRELAVGPRELMGGLAWTSPLNAGALVAEPEAGWALWKRIARGRETEPGLLEGPRGTQPYPFRLPGQGFEPTDGVLAAFARSSEDAPAAIDPEALRRLDSSERSLARRLDAVRRELASQPEPAEIRRMGDLVLSRIGELRRGMSEARLEDFDGNEATVPLDPSLEPHENAARIYDRAGRAERARAALPGKIAEMEGRLLELSELRRKLEAGEAGVEDVPEPPSRSGGHPADSAPALPYRSYRSSGGLEIRVGRGARHNDDLTFRHSRPGDVWLHARDAAGAHVVLRWSHADAPPARDLEEAAVLAALGSRERHSGLVAVDWTRRKHVRKPRGAPPGLVVPARVKTLFVAPDPETARRLATDSTAGT